MVLVRVVMFRWSHEIITRMEFGILQTIAKRKQKLESRSDKDHEEELYVH
jgi:hypothetical protein